MVSGNRDVVEPDDRDVLRHPDSALDQRITRTCRDKVAGSDHGVELGALIQQSKDGGCPRHAGEIAGYDSHNGGRSSGHNIPHAVEAGSNLRMLIVAQEHEPLSTAFDKVPSA